MTAIGSATKAMFNAISNETWHRARDWFNAHPEEEFAYWAKDDFLPGSACLKSKVEFVKMHPEIEDIDDHTKVHFEGDTLVLDHFCPRLRAGIKDFYESGYCVGDGWTVEPDTGLLGNWILKIK